MGRSSYSGDTDGLNLAWSSDLRDAHAQDEEEEEDDDDEEAAATDECPSPADRGTETPTVGAATGETIDGTSADDRGEATTTVGSEEDTPLQRQIKTERLRRPEASCAEIATTVGCSRAYVWETLRTGRKQHLTKERLADLSQTQCQIIEMDVHDNGLRRCDIAAWHGVTKAYVSRVLAHNEHLVAAVNRGEHA